MGIHTFYVGNKQVVVDNSTTDSEIQAIIKDKIEQQKEEISKLTYEQKIDLIVERLGLI